MQFFRMSQSGIPRGVWRVDQTALKLNLSVKGYSTTNKKFDFSTQDSTEFAGTIDYFKNSREFTSKIPIIKTFSEWKEYVLNSENPVVVFSFSFMHEIPEQVNNSFIENWDDLKQRFDFIKADWEAIQSSSPPQKLYVSL